MAYEVMTFDVCVSGMERMRNRDEFILVASIDDTTTAEELLEQWNDDIQCCERSEDFDYDRARLVVRSYVDRVVKPLFANRANPFNLEPGREDIGFQDVDCSVSAFLFIRAEM